MINQNTQGFTLMELVITLLIGSILVAIATESYQIFIAHNQVDVVRSEFAASLRIARSEAIKRRVPVSVCSSGDTTQTTCGGATDWSNGWIVFVDTAGTGTLASANDRIRVRDALPSYVTFSSTPTIIYGPSGSVNAASTVTLTPAHCSGNSVWQITISASGMVDMQPAACP